MKAPVAAAAYNWTGFYLGGNVGYGVGHNTSQMTGITANPTRESFMLAPDGVIGGGQIGYNWQFAPHWVVGVEADIQASGQTTSACVTFCGIPANDFSRVSQKLDWFGTVRGRLGIADGPTMYYVTGGWAVAHVNTSLSYNYTGFGALSTSSSEKTSGWALGGGIEAQLAGNWTAKLEYLYLDLGTVTTVLPYAGETAVHTSDIRNHVARLGIQYRFGPPAPASSASAAASARPPVNWAGFYIGGNAGYGVAANSTTANIYSVPLGGALIGGETFDLSPRGVLGGGQFGFNWHATPNWVLGIEADIQASGQKDDDNTCTRGCSTTNNFTHSQKLPWFGTVRGRAGWSSGATLYYVTGGLAFGAVETDARIVAGVDTADPAPFRHTKTGWTLGGGIETALAGNWSLKAEYLYIDLGQVSDTYSLNANTPITLTSDIQNHVARLGLNYKFAGPALTRP